MTPWTISRWAPPSLGFFRQEHWSGLPSPPPGALVNLQELWSPALAGRFFTTEPMGKARCCVRWVIKGTCRKGHLRALESHGCGQGCCVRHLGESEVLPKWKHLQGQTQNTKQPQQSGLDQGRPRGQALQGQTLLTWPLPSDIRTLSDGPPPVPTCSPPLTTRSPAGCFMKMSLKA